MKHTQIFPVFLFTTLQRRPLSAAGATPQVRRVTLKQALNRAKGDTARLSHLGLAPAFLSKSVNSFTDR